MDLFNLFKEQKDLAKEMMPSPYHLIDLTQVSDEVLRQYQFFGAMALLAKHIHDPDILPFFKSFLVVGDEQREVCGENTGRSLYPLN